MSRNRKARPPTIGSRAAAAGRAATIEPIFQAALARHVAGARDEAEAAYRAILRADPRHLGSLCCLSMICAERGDGEQALRFSRQAARLHPRSPQARLRLGFDLLAAGKAEDAAAAFVEALALAPGDAEIWCALGGAVAAAGDLDRALDCYRRASDLAPGSPLPRRGAGDILRRLGRFAEALRAYDEAIARREDAAESHNGRGLALLALGRQDEAIAGFRRAVALRSDVVDYHNNLGNALHGRADYAGAIAAYLAALAITPDNPELLSNLATALQAVGRFDEARAALDRALALKPEFPEAHNNLGNLFEAMDRFDEAVAAYGRAIELRPGYAQAWANLGNVQLYFGRLADAVRSFERAVELAPRESLYLYYLCEARRARPDDPHLRTIEDLLAHPDGLTEKAKIELGFGLAKAYADLGRDDESFRLYLEANRRRRATVGYDEAAALARMRAVAEAFTPEAMAAKAGQGDPSPAPIFIIGFPRSGTSLIEQILASHPLVAGRGETAAFGNALATLFAGNGEPGLAGGLAAISAAEFKTVGECYLTLARAGEALRVTDKMMSNFLFAGFIHLALPNASIIHARRDPIDTCLSCFTKLFTGDQPFTYDLGELGRYWRGYDELMAHWRRVLPPRVLLEVAYEDLVGDVEAEARRILAHCGLPWDERCLSFHQTDRAVRTASAGQVRQPIYGSSVGRWRRYGAGLHPLIEALGLEGVAGT